MATLAKISERKAENNMGLQSELLCRQAQFKSQLRFQILFLDVLFPLELDRVIFVDSDQIVRTDLKQLLEMDLQGAPYAFTPMGDDREEMEGYRFWKTGYWKTHLAGRPYHIRYSFIYLSDEL